MKHLFLIFLIFAFIVSEKITTAGEVPSGNLSDVQKRIRYLNPHVKKITECKKEIQYENFLNQKLVWSGTYKYEICSTLDYVQLNIPDHAMRALEEIRENILKREILIKSDKKKFAASIKVNERNYSVTIRLKGDGKDHVLGNKWSFRIETQNNEKIFGMREFSIQRSEVRHGYAEAFFLKDQRQNNLLAPRYFFVNYELNGTFLEDMAIEEHASMDLLDSLEFKRSSILGVDDSILWSFLNTNKKWPSMPVTNFPYHMPYLALKVYDQVELASDDLTKYAKSLFRGWQNGDISFFELVDEKSYINGLFFKVIYNAWHSNFLFNIKFYFDPFIKKFRMINSDGNASMDYYDDHKKVLPPYFREYMLNAIDHLEAHWEDFHEKIKIMAKDFSGETKGYNFSISPESILSVVRRAIDLFKNNPPLQLEENIKEEGPEIYNDPLVVHYIENADGAYLEFVNITPWPLIISKIEFKNDKNEIELISSNLLEVPSYGTFEDHKKFDVPKILHLKEKYSVTSTYNQTMDPIITNSISSAAPLKKHPHTVSLEKFRMDFPLFIVDQINFSIIIPKGEYLINQDLITPDNFRLNIESGVVLKFSSAKKIISKNALVIKGTAAEGVYLKSQHPNDTWSGISVLGDDEEKSILEHVTIENVKLTSSLDLGLTGALTFYESNVEISNLLFKSINTSYFLNVVRSTYKIKNIEIENSVGKDFSFEFSSGNML